MNKTYLYILQSLKENRRYVGVTNHIKARLDRHNSGRVAITKKFVPYKVIYSETFEDLTSARRREKFLKSGDGRRVLKRLVS